MLSDLLSDGRLPVAEALRFSTGLAAALRQIHERGLVYGALDPTRVNVSERGVELLPAGNRRKISPYSAPEQIQGKQDDPRSDVFAFGALLYEMLTGCKAFNGQDRAAPRLDEVPPPFRRLLGKCLEIRPECRLQTVQLALIQLRLMEKVDAWSKRAPAEDPRFTPVPKMVYVPPASKGVCPKCTAVDVRQSRPRGGIEEALEDVGARFSRCTRCYQRFVRMGFFCFKPSRLSLLDDLIRGAPGRVDLLDRSVCQAGLRIPAKSLGSRSVS